MLTLPSSPSSSSPSLSLQYLNLCLLFVSLLGPVLSVSLSQTLSPVDIHAPNLTTPAVTATPVITVTPESREGRRGGETGDKTEDVELSEGGRGNKTEHIEEKEVTRIEEGNTTRIGEWREEERGETGGKKTENAELKEERRGNKSEYIEEKEEGNATRNGEWRKEGRGGDESEYQERIEGREGGSKRESLKGKKGMRVVKHFYLWTRRNPGNSSAQFLDPTRPDTISGSLFRASKTFVIIHGFLGWGTEPWILHFKDKLLRVFPGSNVVSVEWPAGSQWWLPSYYNAVGRVPGVAQDLTALLNSLAASCHLNLRDLHLIGHSLGAHVAGLAAAPLQTVGRISGLDPAGLMYHNVPASQRLDHSDADYVDVIHTNGCTTYAKWLDCYGIDENLGHSDFWPNGGKHQPACSKRSKRMTNGEIGCSHEMAYVYYIESLDYSVDQTYFLARPCSSWDNYQAGQCGCGWDTQYMGLSVNARLNGTFYLSTHNSPPYAAKDTSCPPGSATAPGVRIISLALISASALIAGTSAAVLMVRVARMRWGKRVPQEEDVAGSSGNSSGDCKDEVLVGTSDKVPILG